MAEDHLSATSRTSASFAIVLADETLTLLPERAVWWATQKTLFIADLHFGKEATFRAAAIPIPDQTVQTVNRLSALIDETRAARLVILGDLIHARKGRCLQTFETIAAWRGRHSSLEIILVRGNHDESAGDPPASWKMKCVSEPHQLSPFVLKHHPERGDAEIVLAGHLHPAVKLTGTGRDSAKLPCFLLRDDVLTLPAFSSFVDGASLRVSAADKIYGICENQIVCLQ